MYLGNKNFKDTINEERDFFIKVLGRKDTNQTYIEDITENEVKKLFSDNNIKILEYSIDRNSYGEFMFINFSYKKGSYFIYGLGLHEFRQELFYNKWKLEVSGYNINNKQPNKNITLVDIFEKIKERKRKIKNIKPEKNARSARYTKIANMSDDDYAISYY